MLTVTLIRFLGLSNDLLLVLLSESLARRAVPTLVISSAYLVSSGRVVHVFLVIHVHAVFNALNL